LEDHSGKKKKQNTSEKKAGKALSAIIPGEKLGVIEEYMPGQGTYVKDGNIISSLVGRKEISLKTRNVIVSPSRPLVIPVLGSIVEGQVSTVQDKMANIRILKVGEDYPSGSFTGVIHISTASDGFVKVMPYVCKPGDIVRAKVISDKNRVYHLSTAEKDLGVVYAFCSRCGNMLVKKERNIQCSVCDNIEERKLTSDYGKGL